MTTPVTSLAGAGAGAAPVGRVLRRPDLSTSLSAIPLLLLMFPISVVAATPWTLLVSAATGIRMDLVYLLYLAAGMALMFIKPVQSALRRWLFHARSLTEQEAARLSVPWGRVLASAGMSESDFLLCGEDSEHINASAAGGHVVCVTTGAMTQLNDDQLAAVLAHELGHHVGMHTVVAALQNLMLLPINALFLLSFLVRGVLVIVNGIAAVFRHGPLFLISAIFALMLRFYEWVFSLMVRFAMLFCMALGRQAEHSADAAAVELGYGRGLREALMLFHQLDPDDSTRSLGQAMSSTHPPLSDRIRRVEAAMAKGTP